MRRVVIEPVDDDEVDWPTRTTVVVADGPNEGERVKIGWPHAEYGRLVLRRLVRGGPVVHTAIGVLVDREVVTTAYRVEWDDFVGWIAWQQGPL